MLLRVRPPLLGPSAARRRAVPALVLARARNHPFAIVPIVPGRLSMVHHHSSTRFALRMLTGDVCSVVFKMNILGTIA